MSESVNGINQLRLLQPVVSVTKAVAAAANYDAEDVISEHISTGTVWLFAGVLPSNGARGYLVKAQLIVETTAQVHKCRLYLYNASPTCVLNDNVASDGVKHADESQYVGYVDFPALSDLGGDSEAVATPATSSILPLAFQCAAAANDLIGVLVTRDAFTGETATDDYILKLTCEEA